MRKISVAVCTRNRADLLDVSLASLAAADRPASWQLEVIVVLNACSDHSAEVAGRHASRLPLTVVSEPRRGLSHARNAAVAQASGDFILWTDDDVRVHPQWLIAYEGALARRPEASIFGGTIVPIFQDGPPDWLRQALPVCEAAFAALRPAEGDSPISPTTGALPYGANFAIRRDEQRRWPYDPRLGRQPGRRLIGGEEAMVIRSALEAGATGSWVPEAIVDHLITPERQTTGYLWAYFEGRAFVQGLVRGDRSRPEPPFSRELRDTVMAHMRYRRMRRTEPPAVWIHGLMDAAMARGSLRARLARSRRTL